MILKFIAIGLISAVGWLHGANGASYSKVFVQSGGPDVAPVEYYNYGAPAVVASPQIARLSAPPVGSVLPVQTVPNVIPPCVSPCVVSGPSIASAAPSAKIITYNSPNVPVVIAPSKDNGYEYSYVVYDESTGDRKAQRELSDGSVVRGEYSFLQPDGYVREVQYRADDLTGFNVVVKRILPEAIGSDKKPEKGEPAPCPIKNEELKLEVIPQKEDYDHGHEGHHHGHDGHGHGHEGHNHGPEGHDHFHEVHDHEHVDPTNHVVDIEPQINEAIDLVKQIELLEPKKEEAQPAQEPEPKQDQPQPLEPEPSVAPETEQEPVSEPITEVARVEQIEVKQETPAVTHEAIVEAVDLPLQEPVPNVLVSYEDVLRCLQAKGQAQKGQNFSPLTYIIFPSSNRPC